jgi:UDP-N-acetylmuramyl pentapeptide phosphotransferase/UDP-N-acetylglucosamine-1-phosphate transferase
MQSRFQISIHVNRFFGVWARASLFIQRMNLFNAIQGVFQLPSVHAAAWGFGASFALCVLLVLTKRWHGALTMDFTDGVQKFHTAPTPRIGGLSIVLGLFVAWLHADMDVRQLLTPILIAGMPAFLFGVAEDISRQVSVMLRLSATIGSGLLAWWISDYSLHRVDVVGLDWAMQFTVVSVIFTAFAVGGVANSINIIDGFNGLASTTATLAFVGFALLALQLDDPALAGVALLCAASVWGFFWVNWPLGKIFLGDGGSYFIGFALAWVAVMLIERHASLSTFAVLLVCVHPVIEVLFSIFRRSVKKLHPGHPDRLHFHSLVKQRYVRRWFVGLSNEVRNSITGAFVGLMTLTAIVLANMVQSSALASVLAFIALSLGYVAVYARMVRFHWCSPIAFMLCKPRRTARALSL